MAGYGSGCGGPGCPQWDSVYSSALPTPVCLFACLFAALLKVRAGRRLLGAPCRAGVVALCPGRALPCALALPLPSAAPGSLPLTDFHHGSASGVAAGNSAVLGSGRRAGYCATTDGSGRLSLELSLARWCPVGQQVKGWAKQGPGVHGQAGTVCRKGFSRAPHTCDKGWLWWRGGLSPHAKGQLNSHHEVCLQGPWKTHQENTAKLLRASGPPPHVLAAPVLAVQQLAKPIITTEALGATQALFFRKVSSVPTQVMLWTAHVSRMTRAGRAPAPATQKGLDQHRLSGEMVGVGSRQGCCLQCPGWHLALLWLGCWYASRSPTAGCRADTQPRGTGGCLGSPDLGPGALLELVSTAISKAGLGLSENLGSCLNAASQNACAGNPALQGRLIKGRIIPGLGRKRIGLK